MPIRGIATRKPRAAFFDTPGLCFLARLFSCQPASLAPRGALVVPAALLSLLLIGCGDDAGAGNDNDNLNGNQNGNQNDDADGGLPPDGGGGADAGADAGPEVLIPPDQPPGSDLRFDVHSAQVRHRISPYIYGVNAGEADDLPVGLALWRAGGNRWTAYNWENNASNAGSDWYHQNDGYLGGGDTPGEAVRARVAAAHAEGASMLVTVPICGHVAADKAEDGDVAITPSYLDVRFHPTFAAKGTTLLYPPNLGDHAVYQDEYVHWLEQTFPGARTDPARTIFYSLDNEPDLWADTHPRIHPDAVRYDELLAKSLDFAQGIKAAAPGALVFGFVSYGWQGYVNLQDTPDGAGRDFLDFFLQGLAQGEQDAGQRLVDVLDLHWYPEAMGGGMRITADDASAAVAEARMQAPRSLWDPAYTEDSWIAEWGTLGPIELLPRVQDKIDTHYPVTRLAITEYYYGGGDHISGGIAQADVLGIFGREDLFAATLWRLGSTDHRFIWAAFRMFRDFDDAGAVFGDTSVRAATDDDEASAVYAAVDAADPGRMVLVAINRSGTELTAGVSVTHTRAFHQARIFRLTSAQAAPQADGVLPITLTNAFQVTLPALSVTTLELLP